MKKKRSHAHYVHNPWVNEFLPERASRFTNANIILALLGLIVVVGLVVWGVVLEWYY